jgi:hypothetical protein
VTDTEDHDPALDRTVGAPAAEPEPEPPAAESELEAEPSEAEAELEAEPSEAEAEGDAEPPEAEGARRLQGLTAALANLDDDSIARGVATMREQSRQEVAQQLNVSKATMRLGSALAPLLRRKVLTASSTRQLSVAFALVEDTNDSTIAALGDTHEDPSRDDLLEALPGVIDRHGLPLVTLMLAAYASSDARCQAVMGDILDTDERFVLPEPPEEVGSDEVETPAITIFHRSADDPEQVEKRAQRKAAKAAKREAQAHSKDAAAAAQAARREAQHRAKHQRTAK